jgi:hypothetical protein
MAQLFDTPRAQELKPVLVKVISARLKRLRKNCDSVEQSFLYSVGALIESIDCRGRAAPSAPRESRLARNAGLQGPLFHRGARKIEIFTK